MKTLPVVPLTLAPLKLSSNFIFALNVLYTYIYIYKIANSLEIQNSDLFGEEADITEV